jgi:hypothetical protein
MKPFRKDVDRIVGIAIDAVPGLRPAYNGIQTEIARREKSFREICAGEHRQFYEARIQNLRNDLATRLGNKILGMAKPATGAASFNKFADKAYVTNDLARKIHARQNRMQIGKAITAFARVADGLMKNSVDFTKLHIAERQIEREAAEYANKSAGRRSPGDGSPYSAGA